MTLGMQAVGIVIFFILALLLIAAIECLDIYTGVSMAIIIVVCLFVWCHIRNIFAAFGRKGLKGKYLCVMKENS